MKARFLPYIAAAMTTFMAIPAAAVIVTSVPGAPDPGAPDQTLLVDFNGPVPDGYTLSGDFGLQTGSSPSAATPAGVTSQFFYVSSALGGGSATLSTLDLSAISFYWGSIDRFNSVDILLLGGGTFSVSGSAFAPANGNISNSATNRRVFFTAEGDEVITGIRFNSSGVAFELDDVYGTFDDGAGATIPEPETWAMLLAGFGLIGIAARRRQHRHVSA